MAGENGYKLRTAAWEGAMSSDRVLEMRVYRIHHGRRPEFMDRMRDHLIPLFRRNGAEVVFCGPSLHDEDSLVLMRSYPSVAERQAILDNVYSSAEWLVSHEEEVLDMIESYDTAVLAADDWSIDVLKGVREGAAAGRARSSAGVNSLRGPSEAERRVL